MLATSAPATVLELRRAGPDRSPNFPARANPTPVTHTPATHAPAIRPAPTRASRPGGADRAAAVELLHRYLGGQAPLSVPRDVIGAFDLQFRSAGSELESSIDASPRLTLVLAGFAKQERFSRGTDRTLVSLLSAGELFESRRALDHDRRTAAIADSWFATIATREVEAIILSCPPAGARIFSALAKTLSKATDSFATMAFKDVGGRMASLLLELERRLGRPCAGQIYIDHGLSQTDLGRAVGASRETANKVLADFAKRGMISVERRSLIVHDRERLIARAR